MKLVTLADLIWTLAEAEELAAQIEDACTRGDITDDERREKIAILASEARKLAKLVLDHCEVQS